VDVAGVQAAAAARLPPEPAEGAAGSCRVAFRLPDGSRVQRRFNASDTVAALQVGGAHWFRASAILGSQLLH
jgi:hypothetical protein